MNKTKTKLLVAVGLLTILFLPLVGLSQTTGKLAGTVTDADSKAPLPGANIMIEGTTMGAAASMDGSFFILNVSPGTYTVKVQMMGYETTLLTNVRISVNRTFEANISLKTTVIEGQEVIVTADKVEIKKDQTSSVRNVSADEIEALPVESMGAVVSMQAGVVAGHFRGGRNTEVSYLIDGIQVDETFLGQDIGGRRAVSVETEAIQDLEVITGTFNAEYGRAMSGVVNAVTKEGSQKFHGSFSSSFANFFTPHDNIFIGLNSGNMALNLSQDYKFRLEGPIYKDVATFFINYRNQNNRGHLNGIRRFNPLDYSDYTPDDSTLWHIENTGDNKYVTMQNYEKSSLMGKIVLKPFSNFKISGMLTMNNDQSQGYDHNKKYNPDARGISYHNSYMLAFTINHMLSPSIFYEFKTSYIDNDYESYKYENPLDSRYLHPRYSGSGHTGFATGGSAGPGKSMSNYRDINIKYDLTWQATKNHSFKAGFLYIDHQINKDAVNVRNKWSGLAEENVAVMDTNTGKIDWPNYELEIVPHTEKTMGIYVAKPHELGAYFQDKLEFDDMVINIGLRYDYFNSDHVYPSDRRNPSNQLLLPDSMMTTYVDAPPQTQLSPRLGLAYQIGKLAVLRFSYGHFFQMPPMYSIFANDIFRVPVNDYGTTMGNSLLHPQKTISYEVGIWQEVMEGMGLEVALFYKDIYDLLSTKIISTYNQIEYGLYTNKDYGNARGLELKWDFDYRGFFSNINYTLQYTKGNADNPKQTFTRAGNSMDPIKRLLPMSWDQRHTFNASVGYTGKDYGVTATGYYNSGTPYTFTPLAESPLSLINLYQNNDYKPTGYKVDLNAYYKFKVMGKYKLRLTLLVYNLLDRLNASWVYGDTGQAYTTIIRDAERAQHRSNFNDYEDRVKNPTAYSAPRQIKLGLGIQF